MKTMAGALALACSKRSRTRLAPTPTNISTKSEPEIEKNGTPGFAGHRTASRVLPVPGGPKSSTPLGIFAPIWRYLSGCCRKSFSSSSSSIASSNPATSLNVTFGWSLEIVLALALPNCMTRFPEPCICMKMKIMNPTRNSHGRIEMRISMNLGGSESLSDVDARGEHVVRDALLRVRRVADDEVEGRCFDLAVDESTLDSVGPLEDRRFGDDPLHLVVNSESVISAGAVTWSNHRCATMASSTKTTP
jgi:hypothetical protein